MNNHIKNIIINRKKDKSMINLMFTLINIALWGVVIYGIVLGIRFISEIMEFIRKRLK